MNTKTLTIATRMIVAVTVDTKLTDEGVEIVYVRDVALPSISDVMEALDAEDQFEELDKMFEEAQ